MKLKLVHDESTPQENELSVPCAEGRCSGCRHDWCACLDCHKR